MSKKRRISLRQNEKEIKDQRGPNGNRLCRFCRVEVKPPRKTFCSDNCVHEWRLRSDTKYLRKFIYERDLGQCSICKIDTRYTKIEIENAARDAMRESGRWYWKDHPIFLEVLKKYKLTVKESEKSLWEADHIKPVFMGGGLCGLNGIQTLCISCHRSKSKSDIAKLKSNPT